MITPQLVASLTAGDASAWNVFYDDYAPLLYGVIRRQVPDELADTVLKDSMLNIYHRMSEYDPDNQRFFTWIFRITTEACLLAHRPSPAEPYGSRQSPQNQLQ